MVNFTCEIGSLQQEVRAVRKISFAIEPVDVSSYPDQQQRMIKLAFGLFEFTLTEGRTPKAIAEQSDKVSEHLWEIALENHRRGWRESGSSP